MMEEDHNSNKCLICSCSIITAGSSSDHCTTSNKCSKGSNDFSSSVSTSKQQFHRRLYVIFILRNILELPVHQLASHLRNNWEIQDWISLCENCDALVVQCRGIYDQLVRISKKFKLCQQDIIKIVKENSDRGVSAGKSKLKAVNYSEQDKKSNNRFVEEIHNFVLKNDYEHLVDPLENAGPRTCPHEVNNEIVKQTEKSLVTDLLIIKTEPDEELNNGAPDRNSNIDSSMEVQSFEDEDARECEEDEWLPDQDDNYESEENEPSCSGSGDQDELKDNCSEPKRKKPTRRQEKVFCCPLCKAYKKPISCERDILLVCFHLDKCLKTQREKNGNSTNDHDISILKCDFCSIYSCSMDDIFGFVNHLVSCIFQFTSTPLQHRIFHCNICSDKQRSREKYFSLDDFLIHYIYHYRIKYECTECRHLISTTDKIRSHWRRHHKDLCGSFTDYSTYVLKLESPRCPAVPWWCSVCGEVFMEEKERDEHLQNAHPLESAKEPEKEKEKCQFCEKFYYCPDELKLHETTAHPLESNQLHQCDQCSDLFVTEKGLLLHRRWRHKLDLLKRSGKEFRDKQTSKTHKKLVHNESVKKYQCKECSFKTGYKNIYKLHQKNWHSSEGRYTKRTGDLKCQLCSKRFIGSAQLERHKRRQHHKIGTGERRPLILKEKRKKTNADKAESKSLSCHVCQKAFTMKFNLQRHLSNIHKIGAPIEEERTCPVEGCGKVYRYLSTYNDHMATHEMKTFYPCTFCKKVFYVQAALRNHERRVHIESAKKFQCEQCPFKTAHKGHLNLHKKKHNPPRHTNNDNGTGGIKTEAETVKEFICQICGKSFKSMTKLKLHQKNTLQCKQLHMSIEEATVVCHLCGGRFGNKKNLEKHIREQHERIHKFTCEHCNKGFPSVTRYKEHLASVHQTGEYYDNKEQFKCPVEGCGKIIFYSTVRKRHIEHHQVLKGEPQFKCEQCGQVFFADRNRRQHVRSVHQGHKYKKKPKKSNHPKVLNDGPPFKCEQCGKVFSLNRYRTKHLRTVHQVYQFKKRPEMSSQKKVVGSSRNPRNKSTESVSDGDDNSHSN